MQGLATWRAWRRTYVNERTGQEGAVQDGRNYDAATGTSQAGDARETYNPRTGVSGREAAGGSYNRETGDYAYSSSETATGPGGEQVSSEHGTVGGPGGVHDAPAAATPAPLQSDTATGQGSTSYATNNGNLYQNSGSGWEKQSGGGWQGADAGSSSVFGPAAIVSECGRQPRVELWRRRRWLWR